MNRLVILILIFALTPALMGLGTQLWPGGGGGALHPPSGEDAFLHLGENSDHAGGSEYVGFEVPAAIDLPVNQLFFAHEGGLELSRYQYTILDNDTLTLNRQLCVWASMGVASSGSGACNTEVAPTNSGGQMIPVMGTTRVQSVFVKLGQFNSASLATEKCTLRIEHYAGGETEWASVTVLDNSEEIPGTGADPFAEVVGFQLGPDGVNTCAYGNTLAGGAMTGDGTFGGDAHWCLKTPNASFTDGWLILTMASRDVGGGDLCTTSFDEIYVGMTYTYTFP